MTNNPNIITEQAFKEVIEKSLIEKGGYIKGNPADFSRELAFDSKTLMTFIILPKRPK